MRWIQGLAMVLIEKLDLIVSNGYAGRDPLFRLGPF